MSPSSHPTFLDAYTRAIAHLDAEPHHVRISAGGRSVDLVVTGQELVAGIWNAQYDASLIPLIPGALESIAAGDDSVIDALASRLTSSVPNQALGAFAVITCADDEAGSTTADAAVMAAPGDDGTLLLSWPWPTCPAWHVTAVPAGVNGPRAARHRSSSAKVASTPSRHLLGFGDHRVAPAQHHCRRTGRRSRATTAAAASTTSRLDFLSDPRRPPDRSCVATLASPFG